MLGAQASGGVRSGCNQSGNQRRFFPMSICIVIKLFYLNVCLITFHRLAIRGRRERCRRRGDQNNSKT